MLVDPNDPRYQQILNLLQGVTQDNNGNITYPNTDGYSGADPEVHNRQQFMTSLGLDPSFDPRGLWGGKDNESSGTIPSWMQDLIAKYKTLTDPAEKEKMWQHLVNGVGVQDKYKAMMALNPMSDAIKNAIISALGAEPLKAGGPPDSTSGHGGV